LKGQRTVVFRRRQPQDTKGEQAVRKYGEFHGRP